MNCRLPEDTYWVLLIFASQWLTWYSKSSQSPYFHKFPRWFLCVLKFRKHGLNSRAASLRRHLLFCTSLWGSRVMLTLLVCRPCFQEQQGSTAGGAGKLQLAGRIQTVTGFCFKKKKSFVRKNECSQVPSFTFYLWLPLNYNTELSSCSRDVWSTKLSYLSVYRKSLSTSGTDDLVLKLHKCVVLISSFLCIKKKHKNHLPVLLSLLKKTAIKLAILCKCVSWLISIVI